MMNDCPVVGGRKYDVECGLVRRVPVGSDWVISHTVETAIDKTINLHSLTTMSPTDVDTHLANKERPNKICRIRYKVAESLTNSI